MYYARPICCVSGNTNERDTKMTDPTRDEMLSFLLSSSSREADQFDRESAIYWFAANYHSGQWSDLYAALCASLYVPGPCSNEPEEGMPMELYQDLVFEFGA